MEPLPSEPPVRRAPDGAVGSADVVVIGGGIIGCSAAAILADRGARVVLVERTAIGAGASGRNLGAIQHPFDPVLAPLYAESLTRYRALAGRTSVALAVGVEPAGLLLLNRDADAAAGQAERLSDAVPELRPELLDAPALARLEPSLADGLSAVRLATGFPVPPAAATAAWAELAERNGARVIVGSAASPVVQGGRVVAVALAGAESIVTDAVLVAAGPWSSSLVDPSGAWRPMAPTYGVTVQLRLAPGAAPRHIVEEDEVDAVNRAAAATARAADGIGSGSADADPPSIFSLASAAGITTLGSTFLPAEPDQVAIASLLLRRALAFVPGLAEADVVGRRLCARPQSVDGRPFIGPVDGVEGLFVCTGHGPWGISTGPASAAIAARAILDGTAPPRELAATRAI